MVLKGNIRGVYVADIHVVDEERRRKIIAMFARCLKNFMQYYGVNETYQIITTNNPNRTGR